MFQQFENNLNSYMTEKVKEVTGAAEEMFQTASIIQEQELKIKSLQKSKKSLKKQVQELEKELEEANTKLTCLLPQRMDTVDYLDEPINHDDNLERDTNMISPIQVNDHTIITSAEWEDLVQDKKNKTEQCEEYEKKIDNLVKNNTKLNEELVSQLEVLSELEDNTEKLQNENQQYENQIYDLDKSRLFWKESFFYILILIIAPLISIYPIY